MTVSEFPRERFEREVDRHNERDIAAILMRRWKCDQFQKNPAAYGVDFSFFRAGKVIILAEIKVRDTLKFASLGRGYHISCMKLMRGQDLARRIKTLFRLVVRFEGDQLYGVDALDDFFDDIIWFGRNRPRDEEDSELCAVIPWDKFRPLRHD